MKKLLFLHGWCSDGSLKASFLRSLGYEVLTPRLSDWFFSKALAQAQDAFNDLEPDAIVGSSRGAAVAMNLDTKDTPMVLLAPAWKQWGTAGSIRKGTGCIIIHSPNDDLVPFSNSLALSRNSPGVEVIPAGIDHRLNCPEAQKALESALRMVLGEAPN